MEEVTFEWLCYLWRSAPGRKRSEAIALACAVNSSGSAIDVFDMVDLTAGSPRVESKSSDIH